MVPMTHECRLLTTAEMRMIRLSSNPMKGRGLSIIATFAAALVGCTSCNVAADAPRPVSGTRLDSAGIRLVRHESIFTAPAVDLVDVRPVIRDSTGLMLVDQTGIAGGEFLADGRIVIGLASDQRIGIFSADGRLVRFFGRKGAGPGEFRQITGPWVADGGKVVVFDLRQRRTSVFDSTGALDRLRSYAAALSEDTLMFIASGHGVVDGDGTVASLMQPGLDSLGVSRETIQLVVLDSSGVVRRVGPQFPGRESYTGPVDKSGYAALGIPPFGRRTLVAACQSSIFVADNSEFSVRELSLDGGVKSITHIAFPAIRIAENHYHDYVKNELRGRAPVTSDKIQLVKAMTRYETLPVLRDLRCHRDGTLTVELFGEPADDVRRYVRLGRQGELMGIFSLRREDTFLDAAHGQVLSIGLGTDDIPIVFVQAVRGATASPARP